VYVVGMAAREERSGEVGAGLDGATSRGCFLAKHGPARAKSTLAAVTSVFQGGVSRR
jgi:hypothetical protein